MATKLLSSPPHRLCRPAASTSLISIRDRGRTRPASRRGSPRRLVVSASLQELEPVARDLQQNHESIFLLAADTAGYSLASYYTSLGLFVISVPGLWSLIKRSVKSKIVQRTFVGEEKKAPNQAAGEILSFFTRNNFSVTDRGETITFEGMMVPSRGQAALLTFCTCISLASVALVLTITLPDFGNNWFWITALSPLAGAYYWKRASRKEQIKVKMILGEDGTLSEIVVQGDDQQVEEMRKGLKLSEKGMVYVKGLFVLIDPFGLGRIVQDSLVFRQNFSIRSYEIGADRTASIETLMNHLQETALNHVKTAGLLGDGFGSTPEMTKRNLIWVVTKMQVLVDRYPTWGDAVQVDTWVCGSGKNGMRRDWLVRDLETGETLTRASSVWVMMNKLTRKLSKIPEEVRGEIEPYFLNSAPVVDEDGRKLPKLDESIADRILSGLAPRWSDLDVNQHVNNVKYIGWILESAAQQILETHELSAITLEYRRECGRDSVLQSLTKISGGGAGYDEAERSGKIECQHLLRLETGPEIVRARTEWRPKEKNSSGVPGKFSAESV